MKERLFVVFAVTVILALILAANWRYANLKPLTLGEKTALPSSLEKTRRFVFVEATAYAPPLFPEGQLTFSETPVGWKTIAVDPRFIPLGSKVKFLDKKNGKLCYLFEGQEFIALDTGRLIKRYIVDIWMPSYKTAINWGRQNIIMEIVQMPT